MRHPLRVPQKRLRKRITNMEYVVEEPMMFSPGLTHTEDTKDEGEATKVPPIVMSSAHISMSNEGPQHNKRHASLLTSAKGLDF